MIKLRIYGGNIMAFRIRLNKSKTISFRINSLKSGTQFALTLPGITITLTLKSKGTGTKKNLPQSSGQIKNSQKSKSIRPAAFPLEEEGSLLRKISSRIRLNRLSSWLSSTLILAGLAFFIDKCFFPIPLFVILSLASLGIIGVLVKSYIHTLGKIPIENISETVIQKHLERIYPWKELRKADRLWQIVEISELEDGKENGGYLFLYERKLITVKEKLPFYLKTDIDLLQIRLAEATLLLLPDFLLLVHKDKVGAIPYRDLSLTVDKVSYPEPEEIARDSRIQKKTYKYVNNDGSPDRRYKNNIQLTVCEYGSITLKSTTGLDVLIHCSNIDMVENIKDYSIKWSNT